MTINVLLLHYLHYFIIIIVYMVLLSLEPTLFSIHSYSICGVLKTCGYTTKKIQIILNCLTTDMPINGISE